MKIFVTNGSWILSLISYQFRKVFFLWFCSNTVEIFIICIIQIVHTSLLSNEQWKSLISKFMLFLSLLLNTLIKFIMPQKFRLVDTEGFCSCRPQNQSFAIQSQLLTLSQTTNFRLFQTESVCRWQFQIGWKWQKTEIGRKHCGKRRNCS